MVAIPEPRKRPRQARSRATVELIMEAAARVLSERGFAGASTNATAARAGVSVGSLYQSFPNKDAVVAALHQHHSAQMYRVIDAVMGYLTSPREALGSPRRGGPRLQP